MGPRKSLKEIIRWNVTKRQTSWLFIEIAEELNSGLLRKIHLVDRAGLATQGNGLQAVQRGSNRAAILFLCKALAWQINKPVVSNSVTYNQYHFRQTGLLGSSVTEKNPWRIAAARNGLKIYFLLFCIGGHETSRAFGIFTTRTTKEITVLKSNQERNVTSHLLLWLMSHHCRKNDIK